MPRSPFVRCDWLAIWILWSAWSSWSGWFLSAVGHLDRVGYFCAVLLFVGGLAALKGPWLGERRPVFLFRRQTYRQLLPKAWAGITLLALLGGLGHHPDNYDYLSYRFPRVLNWWWAHHWFWIDTIHGRQNLNAVGMEWLIAPLFVFFHTDRLFFLVNFISYLFLPGLVYSVFHRLGIRPRVAWAGMWVLPMGGCFVLQAAGMGNDLFAVIYLLAALHYAFRLQKHSSFALMLSVLSIALLTGAKATNMPLGLPWLVILWQQRRVLPPAFKSWLLVPTLLVAPVISFLPIALENLHHTGAYTGDPTNYYKVQVSNPAVALAGNIVELAASNLQPPLWPRDFHWPDEAFFVKELKPDYPRFGFFAVPLQIEENAGLGLGVTLFALVSMGYGACSLRRASGDFRLGGFRMLFLLASLVAAGFCLAKLESEAMPRLFAPYYMIVLASALMAAPPAGTVVHRRAWQFFAGLPFVVAVPLLVFNPSRPLLPEAGIAEALRMLHLPAATVDHLEANYRLRSGRRDAFAELRGHVPTTEKVVGCLSGEDDPEVSPWLPFGSHGVIEVRPTTHVSALGVRYVYVNERVLLEVYHETMGDLLQQWGMKIGASKSVAFKTGRRPDTYDLLEPR